MAECNGGSSWGRTEQRHFGPCCARNYTLDGWYLAGSQRPGDWNMVHDVTLVDVIQINASLTCFGSLDGSRATTRNGFPLSQIRAVT